MPNQNHEIQSEKLTRDTRSAYDRFFHGFFKPKNFRFFLIVFIALQLYLPALWPVWILIYIMSSMSFWDQKFRMPLRMPKDVGGLDRTDFYKERYVDSSFFGLVKKTKTRMKMLASSGILYLGFMRTDDEFDDGRELWITNSDARTHMFIDGTTGSGKSETLMGIYFNALCWGSGCCYGDGKADSNLAFCLWSLARRMGREDDFLILNYLTGGEDPFERIVAQEEDIHSDKLYFSQSNSMNPFSEGAADFLLQLMSSLLPAATGDSGQWQQKALNMIDALLRTLCYKRAKGELTLSIGVIRDSLALQNLVKFYLEGKEGKIPELAFLPIKAYFENGLPGFNPDQANDPSKWDPEVFNQHGYLTGQFSRILSMMMDTYGFIFADKYPEIDMLDILLNNRLLVVMIPSLEKSAPEAAALGKLYISSIRLMMAQNLGYRLEGSKSEVLDAKATNSPFPSPIISDELAYYFAAGIAVMFAQARSLGFMMVAAVQDIQGLKRGEASEESASMIANTKIKWTLALEDPEDTFDLIKKAGGEAYYSVLPGYQSTMGSFSSSYTASSSTNIEKRDKITLADLKKLNQGEGFVIFKDAVVPSASFYMPDDRKKTSKLNARINRFIQVEKPSFETLPKSAQRANEETKLGVNYIYAQIRTQQEPYYPRLEDPVLDAVVKASAHMNDSYFDTNPVERGIVLFESALKTIEMLEANGQTSPFHHQAKKITNNFNEDELINEDAELDSQAFEDSGFLEAEPR